MTWETARLGELGTIVGGGTPSTREESNFGGEIPWVTPKDLSMSPGRWIEGGQRTLTSAGLQGSAARILPTRSVVLSSRAPIGLVALAKQPLATNQGCRSFVSGPRVLPEFVYYAFTRMTEEFESRASGSTFKEISGTALAQVPLPVPPLPEQRAIAEVLGALDDKIDANDRLASTTDAALASAFSVALAAGSERHPLFDVVDFTFGEAFKGSSFSEPGIGRPLIRIRDLRSQKLQVWTTEVRAKETVIRAGDIVIGMDAEFRATTWLGVDGLLNQRVCRATSDKMSDALLREALREPLAAIENQKSATTVIHLNKSDLARTPITIPAPAARAAFRAKYDTAYEMRVAAAIQSDRLTALRDALLPELVSGRLRVKDAERDVEEVL